MINDRERHRAARLRPSQRRFDVFCGLNLALRNRTPLVERSISRRSGNQAVDVSEIERFETNVPAGQRQIFSYHFCHGRKYAANLCAPQRAHDYSKRLPAKKADRRLEANGPQLAVLSWLLMKIDQLRVRVRILG